MLLAVDIGNTHTVLGLFDDERLMADWRIATRSDATSDELGVLLRSLLGEAGIPAGEIDGLIVSSVVPDLNAAVREMAERYLKIPARFVGPGMRTGMPILYDNPHDVGADRIVNAVAAIERYGAPVIVLDFGTATTFDVVGPGGEYLGGVIVPGLGVSAEALFARAARLHRVDVRKPPRVIGRTTEQSIQSGLFHGYTSLVDGVVCRIREELEVEAPVVVTGGLAPIFADELACVQRIDPGLILEGLRLLWQRNAAR